MLDKKKKIIIFVLPILTALVIGLVWYFWQMGSKRINTEEKPIQKLSKEKAFGVKVLEEQKKIRFLSLESLTLKELNLENGGVIDISQKSLSLVTDIIWSPNGERVILKVENNSAIHRQNKTFFDPDASEGALTTWSYDLKGQTLKELPREIGGVTWLNDERIIYYYSQALAKPEVDLEQVSSSLAEADFDGKNFQKIMDLDTSKFYNAEVLLSPDKKQALLFPEIEGIGKNSIYLIDLTNKTTTEISEGGLTVLGSWSSGGRNIFLYQVDEKNPENQNSEIWLVNKAGVEKKKLGLKAAYPLVITDNKDKYIYLASTYNNKPVIFQVNSGSLEKKIIADTDKEPGLNNITEIGLINEGIFVVADGIIYAINI